MGATFELYVDSADDWRWRLRHDNGNIIADSGEGYASKDKAKQGIRSVKTNAPDAEIEELD
ncbi:HVO_2922 family protein [Halomicroarcula sp. GCM10025709]|uniref:HVO_2922 family protein n=1 Tax=Haloarcula TaxID=2237 RepID=UPI0024C37952|nr:HVO_2922 family protein [Halomicroarcula sp. YJ-61-S]